jgi:ATP-binding protein involved in chromosome partitioning
MSYFRCPHCSERSEIFGHGGGRIQADQLGVPFLGEIPLDTSIRNSGDTGQPVAVESEESDLGDAFLRLADGIIAATGPADDSEGTATDKSRLFERFGKIWGGAD